MARTVTHVRETASRDMVKTKIDTYYANGDALVREWTERDYGIDYLLELFEEGVPTGKLAFLQIKGTGNTINKLARTDEVSCGGLSRSCLEYARQKRIPFLLIYASTREPQMFYYIDLHPLYDQLIQSIEDTTQQTFSVHIPYSNRAEADLSAFFELINSYYGDGR